MTTVLSHFFASGIAIIAAAYQGANGSISPCRVARKLILAIAAVCYSANGPTVSTHVKASSAHIAAVCYGAHGAKVRHEFARLAPSAAILDRSHRPPAPGRSAGTVSITRVYHDGNCSILTGTALYATIKGTIRDSAAARLVIVGTNASGESFTIVGENTAVASKLLAGNVARVPCPYAIGVNLFSIDAMNEFVAFC